MTDPTPKAALSSVQPSPLAREMEQSAIAAIAALSPVPAVEAGWRSMESAPKDRTPVRALIHADLYPRVKPGRDDLVRSNGQEIVVHHPGIADDGFDTGWSLSAPVGHGGFPDEWFVGWLPTGIAASPPAETGEGDSIDPVIRAAMVRQMVHPSVVKLMEAARVLETACRDADAREELDMEIDGSFMDDVSDAIKTVEDLASFAAQPVSPSEGEAALEDVAAGAGRMTVVSMLAAVVNAISCIRASKFGRGSFYEREHDKRADELNRARNRLIEALTHPASDQSDTKRMRAALEAIRDLPGKHEPAPYDYGYNDALFTSRRLAVTALAEKAADKCDLPPEGWSCTRPKGHENPCAAIPKEDRS